MRKLIVMGSFLLCCQTWGQTLQLVNDLDQDLSIKNIIIVPIVDNVSGIYAKPLTEQLRELIEKDKQWHVVSSNTEVKLTPENLEDDQKKVVNLQKNEKADSVIAGRVSKGPNGLSIRLILFSGPQGVPLLSEQMIEFSGFEIASVKSQFADLYRKMKARLPYHGRILSRRSQMVTFNLGSDHGVREGEEITAVQIIKVVRHPKFRFLTSVDRVILGTIKITKVEDALSFGMVISEREENVIQPGTKILSENFKEYPMPPVSGDDQMIDQLNKRKDQDVAFGESPKEWVPEASPSFGKLGILLGVGNNQFSNNLSSGGVADTAKYSPSVHFLGEMWLSPYWFLSATIRQFVYSVGNSHPAGSTPSKLNVSSQQMEFLLGYNFLIAEEFFGPKLQLMGGYSKMASTVDNSTPPAFNSMTFTGLLFALAGSFPIVWEEKPTPLSLGGKLSYHLTPSLSESPTTSGASNSAKISSFSAFGDYRYSERIIVRTELNFDLYSASFSGTGTRNEPASSASQTFSTLAIGAMFLF